MPYANGTNYTDEQLRNMSDAQLLGTGLTPSASMPYTSLTGGVDSPQYPSVTIPIAPPSTSSGLFGVISGFDQAIPALGSLDSMFGINLPPPAAGTTGDTIGSTGKAIGAGVSFITDIPRVATTFVGGLLIAAGLFALANNSRVIQLVK